MTRNLIKIESLSKKYSLRRQGSTSYKRITDVITDIFTFKKSTADREDFWALKDLNLEVNEGDVIGIVGKNGAGKSTLLKILSRITPPTSGRIELNGRVASLLEVGTGFHPELTGRENIYLNGSLIGMSKSEINKHFDSIVEFSGVSAHLDTPVKRYSSGMYVRLAFSVASHLESEILIIDEVLAVGDAEFQKKCMQRMRDVSKKNNQTILFVSHNISMIENLCNYGIYLKNGVAGEKKDIHEVTKEYWQEINKENSIPLNSRTDRSGTGEFRFTNMRFFDRGNNTTSCYFPGDLISVEFQINETHPGISVKGAHFSLTILNADGFIIAHHSSDMVGKTYDIPDSCVIQLDIADLYLAPGDYYISLDAVHSNQFIDKIDFAGKFTVLEKIVFDNIKGIKSGQLFLNAQWS